MIYSSNIHGLPSSKEAEYLSGWQRARAELDNFRKRMEEERTHLNERAKSDVIASLLELADDFRSIVQFQPQDLADNAWAQGVSHVARQFEQLLAAHGVLPIEGVGEPFNPALHEAIEKIKDKEKKSGQVLAVIKPGYKMGERVLKPAKVKIAA